MYSKLADDSRKALIAEAQRLTREERLQAFVRHSDPISAVLSPHDRFENRVDLLVGIRGLRRHEAIRWRPTGYC